jgi:hypothetical protein
VGTPPFQADHSVCGCQQLRASGSSELAERASDSANLRPKAAVPLPTNIPAEQIVGERPSKR